jgi:AcrR family transcriptional regulator
VARTERGAVRAKKILEAAVELFYERGFAAVGVDDIGERAGVAGPAIYRHFRGKDEILATLRGQTILRVSRVGLTLATCDSHPVAASLIHALAGAPDSTCGRCVMPAVGPLRAVS